MKNTKFFGPGVLKAVWDSEKSGVWGHGAGLRAELSKKTTLPLHGAVQGFAAQSSTVP
jgi:hypothetical protein